MDWGGGFRFQLPKPEVHPKLTSGEQFIKNLDILCGLQASVAQIYRPNTPIGPSHGELKYFVWTSKYGKLPSPQDRVVTLKVLGYT